MKKILVIFLLFVFAPCTFALADVQKDKLEANRQLYQAKNKILKDRLKSLKIEYANTIENMNLDQKTKDRIISSLEKQISEINQEKIKLKKQYTENKKQIKNQKI